MFYSDWRKREKWKRWRKEGQKVKRVDGKKPLFFIVAGGNFGALGMIMIVNSMDLNTRKIRTGSGRRGGCWKQDINFNLSCM